MNLRYRLRQLNIFLHLLTCRKLLSAFAALLSYWFAAITKIPLVQGRPISLTIEPTNFCNLDCPECPAAISNKFRERGYILMDFFKQIVNANARYTFYLMLYFQGEPFLHNRLTEMIACSVKHSIYTMTSTNGQFITEEVAEKIVNSGLHEIVISMDGYTQETYQVYRRGGRLSKVYEAIEAIQKSKRQRRSAYPLVHIQFLVFRHNEHEIEAMKTFARNKGVDKLTFKSPQFYNAANQQQMASRQLRFNRYANRQGFTQPEVKLKNRCKRLWTAPVITYNGWLLPCCFDKYAHHPIGNLYHQSLKELWQGRKFRDFRKTLLTNRKSIAICRNCTEGLKVKYR